MANKLAQKTQMKEADLELLETSVSSKHIGERIIVYSSCISHEYPELLAQFKDYTRLCTCLTTHSLEEIAWKLLTIIRINNPKEVAALTIDGSPHCLQVHFALEDILKIRPHITVRHFVIEKGVIQEISGEAVRKARHLSEIEGLVNAED